VGPGKAVEAFDESGKLTLSEAAVKRLGLKSTVYQAGGALPRVALVQSEGKTFVFVDNGGRRYERRAVELGTASGKTVTLSSGVKQGEKVVTSGASSLRVTELDLMAGDEAGHDH
jgi:multidrug efflux pump subunit AcrA (membrane-fusion protein)